MAFEINLLAAVCSASISNLSCISESENKTVNLLGQALNLAHQKHSHLIFLMFRHFFTYFHGI